MHVSTVFLCKAQELYAEILYRRRYGKIFSPKIKHLSPRFGRPHAGLRFEFDRPVDTKNPE